MKIAANVDILQGDVLERLAEMPDACVNCVVTSPPYWGLRDYGAPGQIGLETTPEEYLEKMVGIFREVRRVLDPAGTLWLNMGDCYATGAGKVGEHPGGGERGARWKGEVTRVRDDKRGYRGERLANGRGDNPAILRRKTRADRDPAHAGKHTAMGPMTQPNRMPIAGLKPKDMVGMPWRLALALQADGWWLRSDIIWDKLNPMPESVQDRPTRSHEYIFLLAKSQIYYYDAHAIREKSIGTKLATPAGWDTSVGQGGHGNIHREGRRPKALDNDLGSHRTLIAGHDRVLPAKDSGREEQGLRTAKRLGGGAGWREDPEARPPSKNKRTVWRVPTQAFPEAHFATFPEELIQPCILAGCPKGGVVFDPFMGSGTTALVAVRNGCRAVGIELNPDYIEIAKKRLAQEHIPFQ